MTPNGAAVARGRQASIRRNGASRRPRRRYKTQMDQASSTAPSDWRSRMPEGIRPYFESAPLASFFLGVSSGFPYAMIGATLTPRLSQDGLDKQSITAFSLAFLVYNLKFLWAWVVDGVKLPILGRLGQRVSWLILAGVLVIAAVANLALVDPSASLLQTAYAEVLVGFRSEASRLGHVCVRWCSYRGSPVHKKKKK